jgi:hypothetical protein
MPPSRLLRRTTLTLPQRLREFKAIFLRGIHAAQL